MINSRNQKGSALVVIIIVVVVAILGVLGYITWNNFFGKEEGGTNAVETTNTTDEQKVELEYKAIQINDRTFRYPLNKNNEKIVIIPNESTQSLEISYVPVRNYYFDKVGDEYEYCKEYVAGLINVHVENDFGNSSVYGKDTFTEALSDGTLVRVKGQELYLAGPFKHNEPCADIYQSEDVELKNILSDMKNVRLDWLKSLELVE